jgi:hypothetical protein
MHGKGDDIGILRLDFPGYSGTGSEGLLSTPHRTVALKLQLSIFGSNRRRRQQTGRFLKQAANSGTGNTAAFIDH